MAVFDDRKSKKDKKGAGLNIPVQTNIQFGGGDDFDPFGSLEVGQKVELTSDGNLVAVKEEPPKPEPQAQPQPQQASLDPFDPFASFQPFAPMNTEPVPPVDFSKGNDGNVVLNGNPAPAAAPVAAPVAIDEAALANAIASKIQIPAPAASASIDEAALATAIASKINIPIPTGNGKSIDEAALATAIASKIQLPKTSEATISGETTANIADVVTKNVTKELSGAFVSKISAEVVKNIPATPAAKPEISRDVLDGLVKEITAAVTAAVSKNIKDEVMKELNSQISSVAPTVTQQVSTQVLGTIQQHNSVMESGLSNIGGNMKVINDSVNSLASGLSGLSNNINTTLTSNSKSVDDKLSKLEANLTTNMMGIKPAIPDTLTKDIKQILSDLTQVKKLVANEEELPPTELEKRVAEETEKNQALLFKTTVKPLLLALIDTRESILRNSKVYKENGKDIPVGVYKGYAMDFQDILEKYNVTVYQSSKGDAFDSSVHKLISKVVANKEDQNNTIANSQSCGYKYNGEVIYPEKVEVYNFSN